MKEHIKINSRYLVKTPTGYKNFLGMRKKDSQEIFRVSFTSGEEIKATRDHSFIKPDGISEIELQDLRPGDLLKGSDGSTKEIFYIQKSDDGSVYDLLEVEDGNIFDSGPVVSHNCKFLGSGGALLSSYLLENLRGVDPIEKRMGDTFHLWELPEENAKYVISCDVSEGVGGDYSTIQVLKVMGEYEYVQVARFSDNKMGLVEFAITIDTIGRYYNDSLVIIENNSIGSGVVNDLNYELDYPNLYVDPDQQKIGIRMTPSSKLIGCSNFRHRMDTKSFKLVDRDTIEECKTFTKKAQSYAAEDGKHDDLVMPFVNFAYFLRDRRNIEGWIGTTYEYGSHTEVEEDNLLPIGYVRR